MLENTEFAESKDTVKRVGFVFISQILLFVQTLIFIPAVINVAGEEIFGAYSITLSYLGVAYIASSLGLTQYCRRWLPQAETNREKAKIFLPQLWFQLVAVLFLGALLSACYQYFIYEIFQMPYLKFWVIPAYLFFYTLFSQTVDYFRDTHRTGIFAFSIALYPYLFMSFCVIGYFFSVDPTLHNLILYQTYAAFLVGIVLFFIVIRETGYKFIFPKYDEFRTAISFGAPVLGATFAEAMSSTSDKFLIAGILGVRDVGIYIPAYTLGILIILIPRVLSSVIIPILSKENEEKNRNSSIVKHAAQFYCIFALPYIVIMALVGHDVLELYTNKLIADSASTALVFVALSSLLTGLNSIRSSIFFVRLDTVYMLKLNVIVSVSTTIFTAIFLIIFKEVWMCGLALFISSIIGYKLTSRRLSMDSLNFQWEYKWLLKLFCSVLVMTIVILVTQKNSIQEISVLSIVTQTFPGLVTYAILIFIWMWIENPSIVKLVIKFNQTKE